MPTATRPVRSFTTPPGFDPVLWHECVRAAHGVARMMESAAFAAGIPGVAVKAGDIWRTAWADYTDLAAERTVIRGCGTCGRAR